MTNKPDRNPNHPREVPTRPDPGKIKPYQDPDLTPNKNNPINPETDEPNKPTTSKNNANIKNPIQDDPGEQITG